MKTVEVRHGCYTPATCGALIAHACGSPDACSAVKTTGVVCTFGTTHQVTFYEQADIDAAVAAVNSTIKVLNPLAFAAMTPLDVARTIAQVQQGKNLYSPTAETEATQAGEAHHTTNKALHDANPSVFGH